MTDIKDNGPIQWSNSLPNQGVQFIPIFSPKPGQRLSILITSERWLGVYTHYWSNRTHPCTGDELTCEGCAMKLAKRWKAYLCGITFGVGKKVIVELTHGAMQSCAELINVNNIVRGKKITLFRKNSAKNAPVLCQLEPMSGVDFLPDPFDLQRALRVVWGLKAD